MEDILKLLLFSVLAFATLYVLARILGKKQIAQLNFVDYVIGISLGSIAAEMAFDVFDVPFYYYIIAMVVFFLLDMLFSYISKKSTCMKRILSGKPSVLIYEGKLDYCQLKNSGIVVNELLSLMREQGYFDIAQVQYALLEPSGKLSVMPIGEQRPTVAVDLPIKVQQAALPNYLVVDGVISKSGLNEINKDEEWLLSELKLQNKKQLKKVILASYDDKAQKVITHYKED